MDIEQIYRERYRELTSWCGLMCGDSHLAQELVQEAFLRALPNESLLVSMESDKQRAWLYRTVKNLYIDHVRRKSRITYPEEVPEPTQHEPRYLEEEWRVLLETLPEPEQTLFRKRYLEGYNATELSGMFGMPPGTIRARLSRARGILRSMLDE